MRLGEFVEREIRGGGVLREIKETLSEKVTAKVQKKRKEKACVYDAIVI